MQGLDNLNHSRQPYDKVVLKEVKTIDKANLYCSQGTLYPDYIASHNLKELLSKFSPVKTPIWSTTNPDETPFEELLTADKVRVYLFTHGLNSNNSQLDRTDCSMVESIMRAHKKEFPEHQCIIMGLSGPGFTDSQFKQGTLPTRQDVSEDAGADLIEGVVQGWKLPEAKILIIGHSKGGGNVARHEEKYPNSRTKRLKMHIARAVNPTSHEQFTRLALAARIQEITSVFTPSVITNKVSQIVAGHLTHSANTNQITSVIINTLLTVNKAPKSVIQPNANALAEQIAMHQLEQTDNLLASKLTNQELSEAVYVKGAEGINSIPVTVSGAIDVLTPESIAYNAQTLQKIFTQLEALGFTFIDDDQAANVVAELNELCNLITNTGHEELWIEPTTQHQVAEFIVKHAAIHEAENNFAIQPIILALQNLQKLGVHIKFNYQGEEYQRDHAIKRGSLIRGLSDKASELQQTGGVDRAVFEDVAQEIYTQDDHRRSGHGNETVLATLSLRIRQLELIATVGKIENNVKKWAEYSDFASIPTKEIEGFTELLMSLSILQNSNDLGNGLYNDPKFNKIFSVFYGDLSSNKDSTNMELAKIVDPFDLLQSEHLASTRTSDAKFAILAMLTAITQKNITGISAAVNQLTRANYSEFLTDIIKGEKDWTTIPISIQDLTTIANYALTHQFEINPVRSSSSPTHQA